MAQADSDISTRRAFLSNAAGVAAVTAGGAALGVTLPLPRSATALQGVPDPIFEAIEAHKTALAALANKRASPR